MNPLENDPLALDSPEMVALPACIHHERRGVALAPGKYWRVIAPARRS